MSSRQKENAQESEESTELNTVSPRPANNIRFPGPEQSNLRHASSNRDSRPGVFHVEGIGHNGSDSGSHTSSIPIVSTSFGNPEDIVIDGEIVSLQPRKKKGRIIELILIMFTIIIMIIIAKIMVNKSKTNDVKIEMTREPSLSPTVTLLPTSFYEDLIKQMVLPISGEEALDDPNSIQYFAWKLLAEKSPMYVAQSIFSINNTQEIIQRYILMVVLGSSLGFSDGLKHRVENAFIPRSCDIYLCNDQNEIVVLDLKNRWPNNNGKGFIAKEIGELVGLTDIILSNGALVGTIPTEIGKLKNLQRLSLHNNFLTGKIPSEIGQLRNLELMFLNSNLLSGKIPPEIGKLTETIHMDLSSNLLTGLIPTELDSLDNLEGIALNHNDLSGNLEFLCDNDIGGGFFSKEIQSGPVTTHEFFAELGLVVDCIDNRTLIECSCCKCAD